MLSSDNLSAFFCIIIDVHNPFWYGTEFSTVPKAEFPRDVLNRLRWSEDKSLEKAEIIILHRGGPNDRKTISGSEIMSLGRMFFETVNATIPYHRVREIWYSGKLIFKKPERKVKE